MAAWLLLIIPLAVTFVAVRGHPDSRCQHSGVVANPKDCTRFLVCANRHVIRKGRCPPHYVFSVVNNTCVPAEQVPDCSPPHPRVGRATAPLAPCKESGSYCQSCDRLIVCANIGGQPRLLSNVSCNEMEPSLVCNSATKSCSPSSPNCPTGNVATTFLCIVPGFYPDPDSCKIYHYCSDTLEHFSDTCGYRYDPDKETCLEEPNPEKKPVDTTTIPPTSTTSAVPSPTTIAISSACVPTQNCVQNQSAHSFKEHPTFYLICIPTMGRKSLEYQSAVLRCPDGQVFNDDAKTCQYTCGSTSSRFVDPEDCHSFYECSAGTKTAERKTCNVGFAFNSVKKMCVPQTSVPTCR